MSLIFPPFFFSSRSGCVPSTFRVGRIKKNDYVLERLFFFSFRHRRRRERLHKLCRGREFGDETKLTIPSKPNPTRPQLKPLKYQTVVEIAVDGNHDGGIGPRASGIFGNDFESFFLCLQIGVCSLGTSPIEDVVLRYEQPYRRIKI